MKKFLSKVKYPLTAILLLTLFLFIGCSTETSYDDYYDDDFDDDYDDEGISDDTRSVDEFDDYFDDDDFDSFDDYNIKKEKRKKGDTFEMDFIDLD